MTLKRTGGAVDRGSHYQMDVPGAKADRHGARVAVQQGERAADCPDAMSRHCPACGMLGYGRVGMEDQTFECMTCGHSEESPRPDGRTHAESGIGRNAIHNLIARKNAGDLCQIASDFVAAASA